MKKKEFLTEAKRKAIIADKEKAIIESFAKTFNKIKRIDENEINEVATVQDKLDELVGKPISLIRTKHTRKYNPQIGDSEAVTEDQQINGVIGKIGDFEGVKGLTVMNGQGGKIAFLMYDKKSGEFIEGDSTWKYTYKGADEQSDRILKFILRYLVGANPINEFEELNPLYSRQQEYGINPEIEPADLEHDDLEHDELSEENGNEGLVDARTTLAYRLVKQISGILKDEMYTEPDEYGMTTPELLKTFLYNFDAVDNGEGKIIGFKKRDLTSFTKRAKNYLANHDLIYVDDNGNVDVNKSNSTEIAKLFIKLENL